jgi:hypothetical protein
MPLVSGNVHVNGPGPGNNFMLHNTVHITVNANGTARATQENLFSTCR